MRSLRRSHRPRYREEPKIHAGVIEVVRKSFNGLVVGMPRGGHAIEIDDGTARAIGAAHMARVKGSIAGVEYRSNVVKMGGRMILGVHKATIEAAGLEIGKRVKVVIEPDGRSREAEVPAELAALLAKHKRAAAAWRAMPPSHRREYANHVAEAKKPETRARRAVDSIDRMLEWAAGRSR
jgi:Bacteriocin-protection, YdeI or OmpD-Associated/Domain of unknown function (DUF1905)